MQPALRIISLIIVAFLLAPTSQAFTTMQMSTQQRTTYLRTPHAIPGTSSRTIAPASSTSKNAVAATYEYSRKGSLRYRVGNALGGFKRGVRHGRATVEVIEDVSDLNSIVRSTKEQFVAVFFHSPVCKACQAAAPHYYKLSRKYSDVKFLSVPLTPGNEETLKHDLGVKKFPFGHIYHSQHGLLDELPILRKFIPHFEERLQFHVLSGSACSPLQEETTFQDDASIIKGIPVQ